MAKINTHTNIFTLKSPRVTEKASMLQERNVFVFNVSVDATKKDVEKMYLSFPNYKEKIKKYGQDTAIFSQPHEKG